MRAPQLTALRHAASRTAVIGLCAVVPALLLGTFFSVAFTSPLAEPAGESAFGWDFQPTWNAARAVSELDSPYVAPTRAALDGEDAFVYPPPAAFAAIPFRLLPFDAAAVAFALVLLAATLLALRVLGVRDWRCYGIAFAWLPVLDSIRLGTISALLTLGVALAWRYRDRRGVVVGATAGVIAAKLFLWPLAVWLAAIGRVRQAVTSVAVAVVATLTAWALIGFAGLRDYPTMLRTLTDVVGWNSYSLGALGTAAGFPDLVQKLFPLAVGAMALALVYLFGRRGARDRSLIAAVAAALALSPIVWMHYFALLLVPIALARPRFGPLWLLPLAFWLSPGQSQGEVWRIALCLGVVSVVFAVSMGARLRPAWLPQLRSRHADRDSALADLHRPVGLNQQA